MQRKTPLRAKTQLKAKTALKSHPNKPKKKTGPSVAKLKKEADKWHSLATRYRFAEKVGEEWWAHCFTCGVYKPTKQLQCGHFMSRRHNLLRYNEENTAPQCYSCNVMEHGKQYQYAIKLDEFYGSGTAKKLYEQSKHLHSFTQAELLEIINDAKTTVSFYLNH